MPVPFPARLLIADDHAIVRRGLRSVLDTEPDLKVVAEAADGAEAVKIALEEQIDLAILDVAMPRLTGLQAAQEIRANRPDTRVLILSMYDREQYLTQALACRSIRLRAQAAGRPRHRQRLARRPPRGNVHPPRT